MILSKSRFKRKRLLLYAKYNIKGTKGRRWRRVKSDLKQRQRWGPEIGISMNFYKTPAWLHRRESVLRRDEYLCQECKRYGRSTAATTVHHIIPLAWCLIYNIALALNPKNLISLCGQCHNKMHDRDSDKLTALGLEWVKRLGKMGLDWTDKFKGEF